MKRFSFETTTHSAEETRAFGERLGRHITAGTTIALTGDLGSGKTVFVQGIARGLHVPAEYYITSPTFTLINEYPGRLRLHHIDLYRIEDPIEIEEIGCTKFWAVTVWPSSNGPSGLAPNCRRSTFAFIWRCQTTMRVT